MLISLHTYDDPHVTGGRRIFWSHRMPYLLTRTRASAARSALRARNIAQNGYAGRKSIAKRGICVGIEAE
jgi:hypothetical protein